MDRHIVIVGESKEFDFLHGVDVLLNPFCLRATSLQNMVNNILYDLWPGDRIVTIDIYDHGDRDSMRIGDGALVAHPAALAPLSLLRPRMAPQAVVTLHGCDVGHAKELLRMISARLGNVKVRAGTARQRILPGLEGGVRECKAMVCTYSGPGFWDWVDS